MFAPDVDLVIAFRVGSASKTTTRREEGRKAEKQYTRLLETLQYAGLKAVGRRGEGLGQILVFITCPEEVLKNLVVRERRSDFLSGLPVTPVTPDTASTLALSPADRIRLVHAYISSTPTDGGLGISTDNPEWDLIESISPLQNRAFNEQWIKVWKPQNIASVDLNNVREQFGDAIAYYFAFLSSYTHWLVIPAALGFLAHFTAGGAYNPLYSVAVAVWSICFVEWWRVHERILGLRFGTRGAFKVERRRAQYVPNMPWYTREIRILATLPIIALFGFVLVSILTAIFVFEAFITHLYEGPGKSVVGFSPTILFVLLVPRFLALYQALAVALTRWENHKHQSTYTASLTLKTFALGALVAYSGLALSAFVYVPFGEGVMRFVQERWLKRVELKSLVGGDTSGGVGVWNTDAGIVRKKLNPGRLRDQMFAFTVTNQVVGTFMEIGLPFVLRAVESFRAKQNASANHHDGKSRSGSNSPNGSPDGLKKKVVFEDEKERGGLEERVFLERVRAEEKLPEYNLFTDYNEMVVQFGYVALWSTIWPLAGVMALINNIFELRSDAFKITVHHRRPVPVRTDTIGPWLDALTFLTWLSALTNSALVYLFSPSLTNTTNAVSQVALKAAQFVGLGEIVGALLNATLVTQEGVATVVGEASEKAAEHLVNAAGGLLANESLNPNTLNSTSAEDLASAGAANWGLDGSSSLTYGATKDLLVKAVLVALVASHAYFIVKGLVRHVVEKVYWAGSGEVAEWERQEKEKRENGLVEMGIHKIVNIRAEKDGKKPAAAEEDAVKTFWEHDEGVDEIQRVVKEA
ncbi:hypothetical protein H1R20_g6155, partial [Candolleomyces eurysporus]